jgi:heme/copper-type cytochrome/quinol oxidase subunit 2
MRFAVVVHPAKDFSAAVAQAAASSPASARVKE